MSTRSHDIVKELESISTAVANLPLEMPYTVPGGYFERLPEQVLQLVKTDGARPELEELSPLLASLHGTTPFSVPEGYFDTIRPEMAIPRDQEDHQEEVSSGAVVRSIASRTPWMRMAIAASMIGIIALAAWLMTNRPDGSPAAEPAQVAGQVKQPQAIDSLGVSDSALAGFLLDDSILPDEGMLSDLELPEGGDLALLDLSESSIQDLLNEVTDAALESYVAQNPVNDGTAAMN